MKKSNLVLLLAFSLCPLLPADENLLKNGDAETGIENWAPEEVQVCAENPHSGKNCFKTVKSAVLNSSFISIDPAKKYKISGWFKSANDKKTYLYLGFVPFDANCIQIKSEEVTVVPGTETELMETCKPEDTVFKIKDGSKWKAEVLEGKMPLNMIAFFTDNSEEYKDLPNRDISPGIMKLENKNDYWEVTLEKPYGNCFKVYPAGTKIREHKAGATYGYTILETKFNSPEWKEFSAVIEGTAPNGFSGKKFWHGTKFIKIVIMSLGGGPVYFDDIRFEEQK